MGESKQIPRYHFADWVYDHKRYDGVDTATQLAGPRECAELCKDEDVAPLERRVGELEAERDRSLERERRAHELTATAQDRVTRLILENEGLRKERDAAINLLAEWALAVECRGSSWDDWDEYYKDAWFRPGPLRALLDAEMRRLVAEYAKYDDRYRNAVLPDSPAPSEPSGGGK